MSEAYARGAETVPLLEETIGANLDRTVARWPDRDALVSCAEDVRLSWRELGQAVDEVARALLAAGLRTGDRLGIWSPNRHEWTLVQFATARIGVILVNINPAYRTSELEYALRQSGCRMLIAADSFKSSDYRAMVDEVRPGLDALERVVFLGGGEWSEFVAGGETIDPAQIARIGAELQPSDPINIQYTSGTTGFPKGATLTHRNILNNGYFVGEYCRFTERDRLCIPVPFYHCFGMVMGNLGCSSHGTTMVIPAPGFDPAATLAACSRERCTALYGVPTMFIAMLDDPGFAEHDLSSLRTGIMAGSPCPAEVMRRVMELMHMGEVTIAYGMTETSPVSTQTSPEDPVEKRVATVGRVHPWVEIKVIDPDSGDTVQRGEAAGELCTRGYSVMKGYWEDPERTAEAIDAEGWMHTGDLATMDEDGYVAIVGRSKDLVIRGGENVYPREVEEFLYGHPEIADVQVIGVPDERYGEELMACVIRREGAELDEEGVREFCRGRIAHFKVPRYVRFVDSFPMTVTGKVQKFKLREDAVRLLGERAASR
ncbi:MAG TPA: AMP-binding protein [Solirubrobacteraceae bacterium]|nr:AMP-binding protein [Solirubrobacteraceae bacterium]